MPRRPNGKARIDKPALLLLSVLSPGFQACGSGKSQAYDAYVQLMSAQIEGDCEKMYALVDGEAKAYVDNLCLPRKILVLGQEVTVQSPASTIASITPAHTPFTRPIRSERTIESETFSADGTEADLVVTEQSYQHSFSNWEPTWLMRHRVTVKKTDAGWKVAEFSEEVLRDFGSERAAHAPRPPLE